MIRNEIPNIFLRDDVDYLEVIMAAQELFHQDPAKYRYIKGPVASGKTLAALAECIRESYKTPNNFGVIVGETIQNLWELIPKALQLRAYTPSHTQKDPTAPLTDLNVVEGYIEMANRRGQPWVGEKHHDELASRGGISHIEFIPVKRFNDKTTGLESMNLGWFFVNAPERTGFFPYMFKMLEERLRRPGASRRGWVITGEDNYYEKLQPNYMDYPTDSISQIDFG